MILPEKSHRRGGFSENFLEFRGEFPRSSSPPREYSRIFFIFPASRALFRPVAPRRPPFSGKVREKSRGIARRRPKKVPKGKVQRSVSQAAAVLRRSVPAGATVGRRGLMLQRRRGIRREVAIFGGPPGPPPGRAPGGPGNPPRRRDFPAKNEENLIFHAPGRPARGRARGPAKNPNFPPDSPTSLEQ